MATLASSYAALSMFPPNGHLIFSSLKYEEDGKDHNSENPAVYEEFLFFLYSCSEVDASHGNDKTG